MLFYLKRLFVIWFFISSSVMVYGASYTLYSKKLHPSKSARKPLTNQQLADATYYNQERVDQLRLELIQTQREMRTVKKDMKELEDSLRRFKNYYFRKI